MNNNLKLLFVFIILMGIYNLLCNNRIVEGDEKNTTNVFTYENPDLSEIMRSQFSKKWWSGSWNTIISYISDINIDDINNLDDSDVDDDITQEVHNKICTDRYPSEIRENDPLAMQRYNTCKKNPPSYKEKICLQANPDNPDGHSYYLWDDMKIKSDKGMCTYRNPSDLSNTKCSSNTDEMSCLANTTDDNASWCSWVKSFNTNPDITTDDMLFCQNFEQKKTGIVDVDGCNSASNSSGVHCMFRNSKQKVTDLAGNPVGDPSKLGRCIINHNKIKRGIRFETIYTDPTNIYNRFIPNGRCMESCSNVNDKTECNNRYACYFSDTDNMCINKQMLEELKKDKYSNKCDNFITSDECNKDAEDAEDWHCKWKKFEGSCEYSFAEKQATSDWFPTSKSTKYKKTDGSVADAYKLMPDVTSCQQLQADHPDSYTSTLCENNTGKTISGENKKYCKWKEPPTEQCFMKTGLDIVGGDGPFKSIEDIKAKKLADNLVDPAFYYNSIFIPSCEKFKTNASCNQSDSCIWNESNNTCKPDCFRVGSNNTVCDKTASELKTDAQQKLKETGGTLDDDITFDDYTHCTFNNHLNWCMPNDDYNKWDLAYQKLTPAQTTTTPAQTTTTPAQTTTTPP